MIDHLPREVIVLILLKLPAKTLLKCSFVCKPLQKIIQDQSFINAHLRQKRSDLLLVQYMPEGSEKELYSLHSDDENFSAYAEYEFPVTHPSKSFYRVVGSCDGIICLTADQDIIIHDTYLWNPTIRKCVELPLPRVTFESHGPFDHEIGFAFDSNTNDYKVVRIVSLDHKCFPLEVDIYSLKNKAWKNISHSALDLRVRIIGVDLNERGRQVYLNGALHWVACHEKTPGFVIIAFDVGDEVFRCFHTPIPMKLVFLSKQVLKLVVIQNSLSLIEHTEKRCSVWMMKDYGNSSSWVKQKDINLTHIVHWVTGIRKKGELLIEIKGSLYSFDHEAATGKELNLLDETDLFLWKLLKEGKANLGDHIFLDDRVHYLGERINNYDPKVAPISLGLRSKTQSEFRGAFYSESYTESLLLLGMTSSTELGKDETEKEEWKRYVKET